MFLDHIDQQILSILARDARITNRELSRVLHLSESATHVRWRRLESIGAIRGYVAICATNEEDAGGKAWLHVSCPTQLAPIREHLLHWMKSEPAVKAISEVSGQADYIVEVTAKAFADVRALQQCVENMGGDRLRVSASIALQTWSFPKRGGG